MRSRRLRGAVTVDADMTEGEACQRALALGLREIAFANHVMLAQPDYINRHRSW